MWTNREVVVANLQHLVRKLNQASSTHKYGYTYEFVDGGHAEDLAVKNIRTSGGKDIYNCHIIAEQIKWWSKQWLVVSPHGAHETNVMFMNRISAGLVEAFACGHQSTSFSIFARYANVPYYAAHELDNGDRHGCNKSIGRKYLDKPRNIDSTHDTLYAIVRKAICQRIRGERWHCSEGTKDGAYSALTTRKKGKRRRRGRRHRYDSALNGDNRGARWPLTRTGGHINDSIAVTPGLCFDLELPTGGRYMHNLGHQAEAIFPLLAETIMAWQQPEIIVAMEAQPLAYFEGLFRAILPGTVLVTGQHAAKCHTTKNFHPSGSQKMDFRIGPLAAELRRRAYAACDRLLRAAPLMSNAAIVHLARGGATDTSEAARSGRPHANSSRRIANVNATIAELFRVFPNASVEQRTTPDGTTSFCEQLSTFDGATAVLTPHGAHLVPAIFAPKNTVIFEVMPWDMWDGRGFSYGGSSHYLKDTDAILERVRTVKPLNAVGEARFFDVPYTVDLVHFRGAAAKAKARLAERRNR